MEIKLINLTKSFGAKQVIQPTSFIIQSGSLTTLLGPSGCGKTTLLRMIAGLETPDSGEIWFADRCVFSSEKKINLPPEKRGLGFVFQDFALWPHMTVFENVAFGLRAAGKTDKLDEKVKNALHAVQLDDFARRYPHQLSGGQQQRVAFARAIVIEPACILFDEPLSALDALLREEMRSELRTLITKLGITGVFVTHDQIEAMSMSDAIAVCHAGKVEQYDTPEKSIPIRQRSSWHGLWVLPTGSTRIICSARNRHRRFPPSRPKNTMPMLRRCSSLAAATSCS